MARPSGTTRAKKPILKDDFNRLINATRKTGTLQAGTKAKLLRAFTLLYLTGCRISEIINFKTSDLISMCDMNEYSLTNNTKTNKSRLISFDADGIQVQMIRDILPSQEIYLFSKNNSDHPMAIDSLKLQMNNFLQRVLGQLYSTHSFRSGYVTLLHQAGESLELIREDIGHTNLSTTARYTTVTSKEIAQSKNKRDW